MTSINIRSNRRISPLYSELPELTRGKNLCGRLRAGGNPWGGDQSQRIATLEREAVRAADRLIAVSNHLQREVCRLYDVEPAVVDVIHNGAKSDSFDYLVDAGEIKRRYRVGCLDPTVLFVGRLVVQKGPDILMGAIPVMLEAHSHAKAP